MTIRRFAAAPRSRIRTEISTQITAARRRCSAIRLGNPFSASRRRWRISPDARAILSGTSFVDHQRPAFERLIVEAAYGFLGLRLVVKLDEGKPSRLTAFPIRWERDIRQEGDCREVFS